MGKLSIRYVRGVLEVDVKSAHKLFGRRSQDPYALVYLLAKEKGAGERHAKTWFQENKMKTRTEDKTLDPVWNESFEFVGVSDLGKKSLVIAIWDKDSKTRDDYMAGVRIPMEEVSFFDSLKGVVTLELQHQLADGHPGEIDRATWRSVFGYKKRGNLILVEEKNAIGRSEQGKIIGREKYDGNSPGSLKLSIRSALGVLEVTVKSAKLFGKRSQDPYALVYLLDQKSVGERHAKTWFQEGNMKTKTKDKTLHPVWDKSFRFAGANDLDKKSLVIAIWDKDSRSDDDYMAGVRIPLEEVDCFRYEIRDIVTLELQPQMSDGHPGEIDKETWQRVFGQICPWDLRTCNNHFVTLIEKSRVLAEAQEVRDMYPTQLSVKTTLKIAGKVAPFFDGELHRLRMMMMDTKQKLEERRRLRDELKSENNSRKATFESRAEEVRRLCGEKCYLEALHRAHHDFKPEDPLPYPPMPDKPVIPLPDIDPDYRRLTMTIKIRTEYEAMVRRELDKFRQNQYEHKYEQFIEKHVKGFADKMMSKIDDNIRNGTTGWPAYDFNGLLSLEASRAYPIVIESLRVEIERIEIRIKSYKDWVAGQKRYEEQQEDEMDAKIEALRDNLKELLKKMEQKMREEAMYQYMAFDEEIIYKMLLKWEETRTIPINPPPKKVSTVMREEFQHWP